MNRRSFLSVLAGLPIVGRWAPREDKPPFLEKMQPHEAAMVWDYKNRCMYVGDGTTWKKVSLC